jgi:hypothetical protein
MKSYINYLVMLLLVSVVTSNSQSFTASAGADFVTRYIWRGLDINNSPNIQPSIAFGVSGFELGFWGSYTLSNQTAGSDEIDAYLSYSFGTDAGDFTLMVTDYYFPNGGVRLGDFDDGSGAHTLEAGIAYSGTDKFPISLSFYYNFYNDPGNNTYFEVGYPFVVSDIDFSAFVGGSTGSEENPGYYGGTTDLSIINVGISASKEVKITDDFSLPLSSSLIINPNIEIAYFVFGVGFSL